MAGLDLLVIGAGPAGYAAAIRGAQLGLQVACIDSRVTADGKASPGGTCLNVGCIPSKDLLESSLRFEQAGARNAERGIRAESLALDLGAMMAHKDAIVRRMTEGVTTLFRMNGIRHLSGHGRLLANREVEFTPHGGGERTRLGASRIILAAGSRPAPLRVAPLQGDRIVDSSAALAFSEVPQRLGIIGAGMIGLELGSVWRRLGATVVLIEAQAEFLNVADHQLAAEALRSLRRQGLDIRLQSRVIACRADGDGAILEYQDGAGESRREAFDRIIVAAGRQPNTDDLYAAESGLLLDEWGFVHVDRNCRTNLPGVYAVGDLIRGPMLAHKGMREGVALVERLCGRKSCVNYDAIPSVIYTWPEIAWVGATEQALRASQRPYRASTFPCAANARSHIHDEAGGLVRVLADAETDRILGVHMMAPQASELIASAVIAMEMGASAEDLALTMFAHPTVSEALHEAALGVGDLPLHVARRRGESGP